MKKSIFALALLFVLGSAAMAQSQANLQHVLKNVSKQFHGERWIELFCPHYVVVEDESYSTRFCYEYDDDYMLITVEEQLSEGSSWTTHYSSSYEYDYNYNVIEIFTKDAVNDVEYSLETFTYESGMLSEDTYQEWNGSDWTNVSKYVYNYSSAMTQVLLWEWDGGNWTPSYMYTYTESGNTEELLIQYMQGGAWQNEQKLTYTYNGEGLLEEILLQDWLDNVWSNGYKTSYHYSNGLFDRVVTAVWDESYWIDMAKAEYVYDTHGNAVSGEYFCDYGDGWESCYGDLEMAYGENHNVIEYQGLRFTAEYIDVTSVGEQSGNVGFTFYPNPVNDVMTVRCDDFQKAEVYSLTGAKLAETTSNQVDVSSLQAGMYLLKVYGKETGCKARVFVVK